MAERTPGSPERWGCWGRVSRASSARGECPQEEGPGRAGTRALSHSCCLRGSSGSFSILCCENSPSAPEHTRLRRVLSPQDLWASGGFLVGSLGSNGSPRHFLSSPNVPAAWAGWPLRSGCLSNPRCPGRSGVRHLVAVLVQKSSLAKPQAFAASSRLSAAGRPAGGSSGPAGCRRQV